MASSARVDVIRIKQILERARSSLPAAAAAFERTAPDHPDSIYTLETYRLASEAGNVEMAVSAIAGVARASAASSRCWDDIAEAARLIGPEVEQRVRSLRS